MSIIKIFKAKTCRDKILKLCYDEIKNQMLGSEYVSRLEEEDLLLQDKLKYYQYFYIVNDYVKQINKKKIRIGIGRGSCVASLICYLLGFTKVDPVQYNLDCRRFYLGHEPDIDIDIQSSKRSIILKYIKKKFGDTFYRAGTMGENGTFIKSPTSFYIDYEKKFKPTVRDEELYYLKKQNTPAKFDILSLTWLDELDFFLKNGFEPCYDDIWDYICSPNSGLMQIDTEMGQRTLEIINPRSIEELSFVLAFMRGGVFSDNNVYYYCRWRDTGEVKPGLSKELYEATKDTGGILVFQEQFLQYARNWFNDKDCYYLMKGKLSVPDHMSDEFKEIQKNVVKYTFNKAHAVAYATMVYEQASYYNATDIRINEKEKNVAKNIKMLVPLTLQSEYEAVVKEDHIIAGFKKIINKKEFGILKGITVDNFWKEVSKLPEKKVVSLITLGVFNELFNLNRLDILNRWREINNKKGVFTITSVDTEYRKYYEYFRIQRNSERLSIAADTNICNE